MRAVHTYPSTRPRRTETSAERSRTVPVPGGFMKSVMHRRGMDDLDVDPTMPTQLERGSSLNPDLVDDFAQPKKKITQEEQDAEDKKARKRAMRNLVDSWQERLQLISVITTFFASTEAAMLVNTKPVSPGDLANNVLQASNACLLGALIVHVYAAVLSFLGAFLLIRYKLKEATREEMIAEGMVNSPLQGSFTSGVDGNHHDMGQQQSLTDTDAQSTNKSVNYGTVAPALGRNLRKGSYLAEPPVVSSRPHIEQVGPFMSSVPSDLLRRTHALCVSLAAVGFVLAIIGILCYAWALQPVAVSIFASTCLGVAVLVMIGLFVDVSPRRDVAGQ